MTRQQSLRRRIEALIAEHEPLVMAAFMEGVRDLRDNIQIGIFVSFLERGEIDGAFRALNIDRTAFRALDNAVSAAYAAGGDATVSAMPTFKDPEGGRIVIRFDERNLRAEREIAEHGAMLVRGITRDTEAGLRDVIAKGLSEGRNPRSVALDIAGRINRATGRREGGLIGLTSPMMEFVEAARVELMSGDRAAMQNYLQRGRRDKRGDRGVLKALQSGRGLDRASADKLAARYADGLLSLRAETIARTETLSALNRSQQEAWEQATEAGAVNRTDLKQVWMSARDGRVRHSHRRLNGEMIEMGGRFSNGLRFPGDTTGPARETVNCRCVLAVRVVREE